MKHKGNRTNKGVKNGVADGFNASARPFVTLDVARYQALFDDSDLSPAQKEEFAQSLWSIVITFVELGFGVHPLQGVWGQNSPDGAVEAKMVFDAAKSKKSDHKRPRTYSSPRGVEEAE
ncbi:hypothetical protein OIU34_00100 [Pararhizobium sp. BT-229]|uniref:hypothetical protein n=1 Tax=Pararhizobium sp. BT-229 TaxID=2986923 RepID=UPI0021F78962|nr:hypothetical protein [Pararhizobium sp. BT-229]MCV9960289.1 hypothetical protein [Pararhizobium sp. BT-229]